MGALEIDFAKLNVSRLCTDCTSRIPGTTPLESRPHFFVPIQPETNKSQTTFFEQQGSMNILLFFFGYRLHGLWKIEVLCCLQKEG